MQIIYPRSHKKVYNTVHKKKKYLANIPSNKEVFNSFLYSVMILIFTTVVCSSIFYLNIFKMFCSVAQLTHVRMLWMKTAIHASTTLINLINHITNYIKVIYKIPAWYSDKKFGEADNWIQLNFAR